MSSSLPCAAFCASVLLLSCPTRAQIRLVDELGPLSISGNPVAMAEMGGQLYVLARPAGTLGLWRYDDGTDKLVLIKGDLPAGQPSQFTPAVAPWASEILFFSIDIAGGSELWVTDGTADGTFLTDMADEHAQLTPWFKRSFAGGITEIDGHPLDVSHHALVTDNGAAGQSMWLVDVVKGSPAREAIITQGFEWSASPSFAALTRYDSTILLVANVVLPQGGSVRDLLELSAGSYMNLSSVALVDLVPGGGNRWPQDLTVFKGKVFYSALSDPKPDPANPGGVFPARRELWVTDGRSQHELSELNDPHHPTELNLRGSSPRGFTVVGDRMFFWADIAVAPAAQLPPGSTRMELWVTDGTEAGTVPTGFAVPDGHTVAQQGTRVGNQFLFSMRSPDEGVEYWVSDGSLAGTVILKDIHPSGSSSPIHPLPLGSRFTWFVANDGVHGSELWRTDGSEAGTGLVQDLYAGPASASPESFVQHCGKIFFSAKTQATGRELFCMNTGAVSVVVGRGHGAGGISNELRVSDPVIGSHVDVSATVPEGSTAVLLAGFSGRPRLVSGMVAYMNLADLISTIGAQVVSQTGFQQQVPVPADVSLQGLKVVFQIAGVDDKGRLLVTNGVTLILGD